MEPIDVETLQTRLEEGRAITILDVRPAEERAEWAIPGSAYLADAYRALNAHEQDALDAVKVADETLVVTVCGAGRTSQLAVDALAARGIKACSLAGGMKAWSLAWNTAEVAGSEDGTHVIQVRRTGKGCLSYLIGKGSEAVVIDASLDPQVYLDLAHRYGWQIRSVLDTHIHADHLSRSRQLAERSAAMLFLPVQSRVTFPFTALSDGETRVLSHMVFTALHTPGHTTESTCYLLDNRFLFTGDTLFLTGVGRPDLKADEDEAQARAQALYHSLHKLFTLPGDTQVLPGHTSTPVAFDGLPIVSTLAEIGRQVEVIRTAQDEFVEFVLMRIPPTPPNYERIVRLNETGAWPEGAVTELEAGANRCAIS